MTQELINKKLEEHKIWLDTDGEEGTLADFSSNALRRADLYEANLRKANLRRADLYEANLRKANLRRADLYGANLGATNFREADLYGADLYGANLREADLYGANLRRADLDGANLIGAKSIASFSTYIGVSRIGYAIKHEDCVMFQLGCFWGTSDEAIQEIREKYGKESHYEELIKLYTDILTKG